VLATFSDEDTLVAENGWLLLTDEIPAPPALLFQGWFW
jgi:hypothetical protein